MKVKNKRLREKLEDIIDEFSSLDAKKVFVPNGPVEDKHQRSMLSLVSGTFNQWFDDLTDRLPERVYVPSKELDKDKKGDLDRSHPLSDLLPFAFADSLYTDADRDTFFKDYRNEAVAHIPSAAVSLYVKSGAIMKPVANVYSNLIYVDEDFVLSAPKAQLRAFLLSVTYLYFLCDELDFTRGLEG